MTKASKARGARPRDIALVGLVSAVVAFAGVFSLPALDRDEARFAQATVQMLETRDFVTIRFQDAERNKKPVGIHWLQAGSVSLFSTAEARAIFAYRLPSVAGAIIACIFTYILGARLYGAAAGLLAGLLLAASPVLAAESTIAKTDAMLLATIAIAMTALAHVYLGAAEGIRRAWTWPIVFWTALAAGVLIKGPIAPMVLGLGVGALILLDRRTRFLGALRPASGALLVAASVLPWVLAVNAATDGRFLAEALGRDMIGKLGAAQEGHSGPPGYHLALLPILFWPALALLAPAGAHAVATRRAATTKFLVALIVPSWIVLELTATKLPHYTLPLYPAIAILCARAALASPAQRHAARRLGAAFFALVGAGVGVAIIAVPAAFSTQSPPALAYAGAATVIAAAIAVARLFWMKRPLKGAIAAVALAACVNVALLEGVLPRLDALALSPRLSAAIDAAQLHALRDGAPPTALAGYYEPSAVFLLGTKTALVDGAGAARHLAAMPGSAVGVEARELAAFRAGASGLPLRELAVIDGFNYSKGERLRIHLYTSDAS